MNDQAPGPPVGSVETMMSALLSTAAQAVAVGHETPLTGSPLPAATDFQEEVADGLEEVMTRPALAETQRVTEGQETPFRFEAPPGNPAETQALGPAAGAVETRTAPSLSTATQRATLGQETPRRS